MLLASPRLFSFYQNTKLLYLNWHNYFYIYFILIVTFVTQTLSISNTHSIPLRFEKAALVNSIKPDQSSKNLYNLFIFKGAEHKWADAQVSIEAPLKKNDRSIYSEIRSKKDRSSLEQELLKLLPSSQLDYQGTLRPADQLVPQLWVIWITESTPWSHSSHLEQYFQLFESVKMQAHPHDYLFLIKGGEYPQILVRGTLVEDWQVKEWQKWFKVRSRGSKKQTAEDKENKRRNKKRKKRKKRKNRGKAKQSTKNTAQVSPKSITPIPRLVTYTSAVQTLWYHLYMMIEQFWQSRPNLINQACGQPCHLMIPHVKLLILSDEIKTDKPIHEQFKKRTQLIGHSLYGLHILQVHLNRTPSMPPLSLRVLRDQNSELTHTSHIKETQTELKSIQKELSQMYYLLPMVQVPIYHWSRGSHLWTAKINPHQIAPTQQLQKATVKLPVEVKIQDIESPNLLPHLQAQEPEYIRQLNHKITMIKKQQQDSNLGFIVIRLFLWFGFMLLLHIVYVQVKKSTKNIDYVDISSNMKIPPIIPAAEFSVSSPVPQVVPPIGFMPSHNKDESSKGKGNHDGYHNDSEKNHPLQGLKGFPFPKGHKSSDIPVQNNPAIN